MKTMINKQRIKDEIDKVKEEDLLIIYRIIQALVRTPSPTLSGKREKSMQKANWFKFINTMYGCMSDDPIERGQQGECEIRDMIE